MAFIIRYKMVDNVKDNQRNKYRTLVKDQEAVDPGLLCPDVGRRRTARATVWTARSGRRPGMAWS